MAELQSELDRLTKIEFAGLRKQKIDAARQHLLPFTEITMPKPSDENDPTQSRYVVKGFHASLAMALEEIESGENNKLIITFPPRHGKTELASNRFISWLVGRDPYRHIIFGTYNQPFADKRGRIIRNIIKSNAYRQIFPDVRLAKGEQASASLATEDGGELAFVGRGGSSTGRGADFLIIDDPHKDRKEAQSETTRNDVWQWYNDTMETRLMSDSGAIVIIMTRWHEDDLVGRLTDETNPCYNEEEAKSWKIVNIRALAEDDDVLGRPLGEPLWPEKFGLKFLESKRRKNPVGFAALYQQRPSPEDGENYKPEMLLGYDSIGELPKMLRYYISSDHATSEDQRNDPQCILVVGVDTYGTIWILPDLFWERCKTDVMVEKMLDYMRRYKPLLWWAGKDHISKSIGPFLYKRMKETRTYIHVVEQSEAGDKLSKAQPAIGRASMGMIKFPTFAPWWGRAKSELLKFPNGRNDDFADCLSHICRGLERIVGAPKPTEDEIDEKRVVGSMAWIKSQSKFEAEREKLAKALRAA